MVIYRRFTFSCALYSHGVYADHFLIIDLVTFWGFVENVMEFQTSWNTCITCACCLGDDNLVARKFRNNNLIGRAKRIYSIILIKFVREIQ